MTDIAALVAEWRKAMEGVTAGPWAPALGCVRSESARHDLPYETGGQTDPITVAYCGDEFRARMGLPNSATAKVNAAWIARCSPDAISVLLDALEAQAREIGERPAGMSWAAFAQKMADRAAAAEARVAELVEGLRRSGRLQTALDYLAENTGRSLAFDGKFYCEDDNSDLWIVTEVQGGINDREWVLIGSGATPAEALINALPDDARSLVEKEPAR